MQPTPCRRFALFVLALMVACGVQDDRQVESPSSSFGQVASGTVSLATHFAASRLAEQASFGPTPELVARIRAKGIEAWIDEQLALPPSLANLGITETYEGQSQSAEQWYYQRSEVLRMMLTAPDQLRLRVSWALSQFVVVSSTDVAGTLHWWNLLQRMALGSYRDLLYQASINAAMGAFLNNNQNRPKSAICPHCAPNENFSRELMQLFTIGTTQLNLDGTPVRDARGRSLEVYAQVDVEQLARALTGWQHDPDPPNRPARNWANWGKPMVPSTVPAERDSGEKVVLGRVFPAGQSAPSDLSDAIDLLVGHRNAAPFVSLRLIQHLVKSEPTPDYVARVARVFRNDGAIGALGDLRAVVRAVLLDPEARAGDNPMAVRADDGKLREPVLHRMAAFRGLACQRALVDAHGSPADPPNQRPLNAGSVFSFYAPSDRAPGSNLLAPEQTLLTAEELMWRFRELRDRLDYPSSGASRYLEAGCKIEPFVEALEKSPRAYTDLLSERFFRGAMPPTLRWDLEELVARGGIRSGRGNDDALGILAYALATPYFGAIK